jgi:hypothetical protein
VIRFLVRWAFRCVVLLMVLTVGLILLKDVLVKAFVEHRLRKETGMDVNIAWLEVGLLSPTLTIADLKLYNPAEFGGSPFLQVPDLHVEYRPEPLLFRKLHFTLVRLSLAEVNIVEGRDGRTNVMAVLPDLATVSSRENRRESLLGFDFKGIDTLNLSLGTLRYSSLRKPGKSTEIKVGLRNEIFTNVRSIAEARDAVLKKAFRNGITVSSSEGRR